MTAQWWVTPGDSRVNSVGPGRSPGVPDERLEPALWPDQKFSLSENCQVRASVVVLVIDPKAELVGLVFGLLKLA